MIGKEKVNSVTAKGDQRSLLGQAEEAWAVGIV